MHGRQCLAYFMTMKDREGPASAAAVYILMEARNDVRVFSKVKTTFELFDQIPICHIWRAKDLSQGRGY